MNPNRQAWNEQQQELQNALHDKDHARAIELFLTQHAATHSAEMSGSKAWSFADEVFTGLDEPALRSIPPKGEHSIAWILWHLARIEDVTMNLLVAGTPQLFHSGWQTQLKTEIIHTGNALGVEAVRSLSETVDLEALKTYRNAVGRRTREIVPQIEPHQFNQKVEPARLETIRAQGAVLEEANEIIAYWGGRTIAGLLLMPPTRHNFLHLNEALRLRQKLR